ncbi:MAG: hypothetical protein COA94_04210 [Rickettsiales bacterium]|nr:MAG: hypothetical protein COA94_04210 [Rickettsiales bacterium]
MNKIRNIAICLCLTLFANITIAADKSGVSKSKTKLRDPAEFLRVIDDYKAYVATVSPETRDEIIVYRKEIAKLNKEKKLFYRKLSKNAQGYLKQEQKYKKKLPLNRKSLINIQTPGQKKSRKKG